MTHSLFFLSVLLLLTLLHSPSDAATKLVDKVCKQTWNYSFCVESLYSDSRAGQADEYTLAFISVGLAYTNATDTRDLISKLLINKGKSEPLETCFRDYKKAVSSLEVAYNDLNSETFFVIANLTTQAARSANHCETAFKGNEWRPLGNRNKDLMGLCEICGIVAELFTGPAPL
ncbi:hypothetical protein JCGZ_16417 [Jatropha curcas]|uniref:Pectinesterase inhibitor domain-containing protein n=1 Tax=Jatropha curcas TaxID=180498 RepID=A0A067K1T4_JATCU|nr:uncharacterized protein LOC105642126 [Jatropha curcas]KDP29028.1 hypothetical protein JCGZ_16417 [Jatropha curcas]